jgi:hypothetical protein
MENVWFLVLVAVVGVIRWAFQAAESRKNEQAVRRKKPGTTSPLQRAPAESEEERMRRFFEALGAPKGEGPPRKVVLPRAPKKILPVDAFPVPRSAATPAVVVQTPSIIIPPLSPAPAPAPVAQPVIAEPKSQAPPLTESGDDPRNSIAARLGNSDGLRDAIILREIFGPPRSMQPLN